MDPNVMIAARVFHAANFAPHWPDGEPYPESLRLREVMALAAFYHDRTRFPSGAEYHVHFPHLYNCSANRAFAARYGSYPM
jgi:hypothetical protein